MSTPRLNGSVKGRPASIAIKALAPFRRGSSKKAVGVGGGGVKGKPNSVPTPRSRPLPELRIQLSEDNDNYSSCYSTTPESPLLGGAGAVGAILIPPPPSPPPSVHTSIPAAAVASVLQPIGPPERRRADSCVVPLPSEKSSALQLPGGHDPPSGFSPTLTLSASHSEQFTHDEIINIPPLATNRTLHKSYSEILRASNTVEVAEDVAQESRQRSRSYCAGIDVGRRQSTCSSMQQGSSKTLLTVPSLSDLLTDQRLLRQGVGTW
jgi:hypothetical protein